VGGPPVLLIDELDRTDEPFEAYLLEILAGGTDPPGRSVE
jgi:MoxR-like ATPase